jgi:hypothetical protein
MLAALAKSVVWALSLVWVAARPSAFARRREDRRAVPAPAPVESFQRTFSPAVYRINGPRAAKPAPVRFVPLPRAATPKPRPQPTAGQGVRKTHNDAAPRPRPVAQAPRRAVQPRHVSLQGRAAPLRRPTATVIALPPRRIPAAPAATEDEPPPVAAAA